MSYQKSEQIITRRMGKRRGKSSLNSSRYRLLPSKYRADNEQQQQLLFAPVVDGDSSSNGGSGGAGGGREKQWIAGCGFGGERERVLCVGEREIGLENIPFILIPDIELLLAR